MESTPPLSEILADRKLITYVPLRTEVDAERFVSGTPAYVIQPRPSLDPRAEALAAMESIRNAPAAVLMPGRRFDSLGTRLGQGGGWYDRFLARVPDAWLRVGFCFEDQFSPTPLKREVWDQPMDFVCVMNRETDVLQIHASGRLDT
jgi:hypothetical protein